MTFEEILDQAMAMLQRRGRLTYSTLKRQFQLDDAALEDVKNEFIYGQRLAVDEEDRVLVWTGELLSTTSPTPAPSPVRVPLAVTPVHLAEKIVTSRSALEGERKQITVLFADLKGSMELLAEPRPRGGPPAPGPGPGAHDRGRAPLRGHRQSGHGGWHYGPLRRPHCP